MSENQKQWYVVRAIGGKENKVKEYLEAEIRRGHLEDYISQVLIPTEKVYTIRNGKKVSKEKPSYPGYVLVEALFEGQIPSISPAKRFLTKPLSPEAQKAQPIRQPTWVDTHKV